MWIVPWDPFLMKKLIKNIICGSVNSAYVHCSRQKVNNCGYVHWTVTANIDFSTMNSASVHCLRTHKFHFSVTFSLKMGPTTLFTHLKIILLQYFQFSVLSFSKISSIQTDPIFRKYESFPTHENGPTQSMHISNTCNTFSPDTWRFEGATF